MQAIDELEQRRRAYLDAMGIQVWQLRSRAPAPDATRQSAPELPSEPQGLAADWPVLEQTVLQCRLCGLHEGRTQAVFGVGDRAADWLVIGEAPGAEEDRRGEPFVGRAGQMLNAMLKAVGLRREQVYIANIVKCRPPNNRDPRPEEAASCRQYLIRQVELIRPRLILAVGRIAAHNLLGTDSSLGKLRGRIHHFGAQRIPLVVTYHPAYLLRSPDQKAKAWSDLLLARSVVRGEHGL
ncbi:MAG: uracil-DNA glycosylase [Gammaproteobacteria bacterium]